MTDYIIITDVLNVDEDTKQARLPPKDQHNRTLLLRPLQNDLRHRNSNHHDYNHSGLRLVRPVSTRIKDPASYRQI